MTIGGAAPRKYADVESEQSEEYRQWIDSPEFGVIAEECKRRAENRCQFCNKEGKKGTPLHAHHRTYRRMKTAEEINDLVALCRRCHFGHHDMVKELDNQDTLF